MSGVGEMGSFAEVVSCTASLPRQTGTFTYRICGFPALKDGVGDTTESPEFELCRRKWQLRIFPGGSLVSHSGYVSYYLASKSNKLTRASYKLIIVNQRGESDEIFQSNGIRKFEAKGESVDGWGRDKFIERSALLSNKNGLCVDDTVVFKVEITVYSSNSANVSPQITIFHTRTNVLMSDIEQVYLDLTNVSNSNSSLTYGNYTTSNENGKIFSDVTLRCQGKSIQAHRFILCARSPVFCAMLTGDTLEASEGRVDMEDMDIYTLNEMLRFMYCDTLHKDFSVQDDLVSLFVAANKYNVKGLSSHCEELFCGQMNIENVCDIVTLADIYNSTSLKQHCMGFITKNAHHILLKGVIAELECDLRREVLQAIYEANICITEGSIDAARTKKNFCLIL